MQYMISEISSRQNPRIRHFRKLLASRAYRHETRLFVADGIKMLREALLWNAPVTEIVCIKEQLPDSVPDDIPIYVVPKELMLYVSEMDAPQGVLFSCKMPENIPLSISEGTLILDAVQDPGNVGTILRTADAFDVPLVLSDGSADLYNPKTVRASMGAVFRRRVQCADKEQIISFCREHQIKMLATALTERAQSINDCDFHAAFLIGSEGKGLCAQYLQAADGEVIIPMNAHCESLNAAMAAGIVMWELKKNR